MPTLSVIGLPPRVTPIVTVSPSLCACSSVRTVSVSVAGLPSIDTIWSAGLSLPNAGVLGVTWNTWTPVGLMPSSLSAAT